MRPLRRLPCVAFVLWVLSGLAVAAVAERAPAFPERLAAARALRDEGSHALARDAFQAALELAPDDDARRRCELEWLQASLAAPPGGLDRTALSARVVALLAPYANNAAARDDFWADAMSLSALLQRGHDPATSLAQNLAVAQFWADQPPGPEPLKRFEAATTTLGQQLVQLSTDLPAFSAGAALLRRSLEVLPPTTPGRARVALLHAQVTEKMQPGLAPNAAAVRSAYADAVAAARGTSLEPEARLLEAWWWTKHARRHVDVGAPESFDTLLARLDAALALSDRLTDRSTAWLVSHLRKEREGWATPAITLELDPVFLPGSRLAAGVVVQHLPTIALTVYKLSPGEFTRFTAQPPGAGQVGRLEHRSPVATWTVSTGLAAGARGRVRLRSTRRDDLPPGFYLLAATAPAGAAEAAAHAFFQVSYARVAAFMTNDGVLDLHAFDQTTGAPLKELEGTAWQGRDERRFSTPGLGSTRLRIPENRAAGPAVRVVGTAAGQPFFVEVEDFRHRPGSEWRFHLLTDRPLYLPGETARWKLTARESTATGPRTPAGTRVRVTATAADDTALGSWEAALNPFGSTSGEIPLPTGLRPGNVRFHLEIVGARPAVTDVVQAFSVDRFRVPEMKVSVAAAPGAIARARPGGEIELVVNARYFSGDPVVGGNVTVTAKPELPWRELVSPTARSLLPRTPPEPITLAGTTDTRGEARLRLPLAGDLGAHATFSISAQAETAGTRASASLSFALLEHGYLVDLAPAAAPVSAASRERARTLRGGIRPQAFPTLFALPGAPLALALQAWDGSGSPVSAIGEITLRRRLRDEIWRAPDGRLVAGELLAEEQRRHAQWPPRSFQLAPGWELIRGEDRHETVTTLPLATDATGRSGFSVPPLTPGVYEITYDPLPVALSQEHQRPLARLDLHVADASTTHLPAASDGGVQIIPCDPVQTPGQPVRALVVLPLPGRHVWLNLATASGSQARTETFAGNARIVEFPWTELAWNGARVEAGLVGGPHLLRNSAWIEVSRAAHENRVTLAVATDPSRPGGTTRLTVRTTDAAGAPLRSEVALVAADAAVVTLLSDAKPERDTFLDLLPEPSVAGSGSRLSAPATYAGPRGNLGSQDNSPAGAMALNDDEVVELSPFTVATSDDQGYGAGGTLAGSAGGLGAGRGFEPADERGESTSRVRSRFSYTAAWFPDVQTDAQGHATVEFTYPDNLTAWRIDAEAVSTGQRFGAGCIQTRTTLPLQARLRTPRALVAGDTTEVVGALINATDAAVEARGELSLEPAPSPTATLTLSPSPKSTVPAQGEQAHAWTLKALASGTASLRFAGHAGAESDAMKLDVPVREDGLIEQSGVTGTAEVKPLALTLTLPTPLDPARTTVDVQIAPGIVPALVEALPYLIDYPYGCVEQTMSRFLPAVAVAGLLRDSGVKPLTQAPFDRLPAVLGQSLDRLRAAQHHSGAFGWWPGGPPDTYMTATVLRGLNHARRAGVTVPDTLHTRLFQAAVDLMESPQEPDSPQVRAWLLAAVARYPGEVRAQQRTAVEQAFDDLFATRAELTPSGIALLLDTAVALGRRDPRAVLLRNLENGVTRARTAELGETALWGRVAGYFDGMEGAAETTALCLHALLAAEPRHPLVEPAVKGLLSNRQSGRWSNTRDTALAVLALHAYAAGRRDLKPDAACTVSVNGQQIAAPVFTPASLLAPFSLRLDAHHLRAGRNEIVVTRTDGKTPCHVTVVARSWAQAEAVLPAGDFLRTERAFTRIAAEPTVLGNLRQVAHPLPANGAVLAAGESLECRLLLETTHPLSYVMIASPKPAGCEPLNPLSGRDALLSERPRRPSPQGSGVTPGEAINDDEGHASVLVYREEFDDRSVFFLDHLPAGRWELRYTLRAVFAGDFRVLPVTAEAMYVPVIAARTDARRVRITSGRE